MSLPLAQPAESVLPPMLLAVDDGHDMNSMDVESDDNGLTQQLEQVMEEDMDIGEVVSSAA